MKCQPICGCKGKENAEDCKSLIVACILCWGNKHHPAEKKGEK